MPRGVRPFAGNAGRYTPVEGNGRRLWIRDQVTLQQDIVALLQCEGALPKKRIILALCTAQAAIETALAALLEMKAIERYRAKSSRGRMDELWCVEGQAPRVHGTDFRAMEILAAFQQAAAQRAGGMSA